MKDATLSLSKRSAPYLIRPLNSASFLEILPMEFFFSGLGYVECVGYYCKWVKTKAFGNLIDYKPGTQEDKTRAVHSPRRIEASGMPTYLDLQF
jgi:hypothetical protein